MAIIDLLLGGRAEDRFARRVIARMRARGVEGEIRYDPSRFEVFANGQTTFLGNIFEELNGFPFWRRHALLDEAITFIFEDEKDDGAYEEVKDLLLPVLRSRAQMEMLKLDPQSGVKDGVIGVVAEHLVSMVAMDMPASIRILTIGRWEEWGRAPADLLETAIGNLRARGPAKFDKHPSGFFVSEFRDDYDASRLLLPEMFEALPLRGRPVAVVVSRTTLLVAGSDDIPSLNAMATFAHALMVKETRPIARAPIILRDGRWSPFIPEADELAPVRILVVEQQLWDYGCQIERLQPQIADRIVAPLEAYEDGPELRTCTFWTPEAPHLLPPAEAIALGGGPVRGGLIRFWKDVETVCGPFRLSEVSYPIRYAADAWPTDEQWRRLQDEFYTPGWMPD